MAIIKEAEFKKCGECGNRNRVADEVRGCDVCKIPRGDDDSFLQIDVFHNSTEGVDRVDCCSWACALIALPKIETDYFVSLPYLHYDDSTPKGARAADFFAALAALNVPANT